MLQQQYFFADAAAASEQLRMSVSPIFSTLATIAAVLCVLFVVFGGLYCMTSAGSPENIMRAKKTVRNSIIGFVLIIGAAGLVSVMQNAYNEKPIVTQQSATTTGGDDKISSFGDFVNEAVKTFISGVVSSISKPVVEQLKQYTQATPLMAENAAVFNYWMIIVAMADVLFLLVIGLVGFRVMSASVLGFEDVELKTIAPQIVLAFLGANLSIYIIDIFITLSNAMIQALLIGMSTDVVWAALGSLFGGLGTLNIGILLFVAVVLILGVILLIHYLVRVVALYVGAVVSPLVVLLWLLPSFRDFAITAAKRYIITIFVLFVNVVILMLSTSFFSSAAQGTSDPFLASLYGIATLLALIKTSSFMNQMAFAGSSNLSMRKLGNTFVRSSSHLAASVKKGVAISSNVTTGGAKTVTAVAGAQSNISTHIVSSSNPNKFDNGSAAHSLATSQQLQSRVVGRKIPKEVAEKRGL